MGPARADRGLPPGRRPTLLPARRRAARAAVRWGGVAGLQVGDRVSVPGPGLGLSRAVLASKGGDSLYVDTLKNKRARTVPLNILNCGGYRRV